MTAAVLRVRRWRAAAGERGQVVMAFISDLTPRMLIMRFIL
jgi:hypothetical protein